MGTYKSAVSVGLVMLLLGSDPYPLSNEVSEMSSWKRAAERAISMVTVAILGNWRWLKLLGWQVRWLRMNGVENEA